MLSSPPPSLVSHAQTERKHAHTHTGPGFTESDALNDSAEAHTSCCSLGAHCHPPLTAPNMTLTI